MDSNVQIKYELSKMVCQDLKKKSKGNCQADPLEGSRALGM